MNKFHLSMQKLLLSIYFVSYANTITTFCSSYCSSTLSCAGITKLDCLSCTSNLFTPVPDLINYPTDPCRLLTQTQYIISQLSVNSMDVTTFLTSNNATITCGMYQMSGKYVDYDYIAKNYTELATNHYEIVVRFSIGYIGTWSSTQFMNLNIQHQYANYNNSWSYSCPSTQFICSGTGLDCFEIKQFVISHNNSFLFLNFTALYHESDPNHQFWGIKDLIIVSKLCHSSCLTCIGSASTQCTSCTSGFYLNGNICVSICPILYIPSLKQCTSSCPLKYYKKSANNFCQPCLNQCLYCTNSSSCIIWQNQDANPQNSWKDYLGLWVTLIIIGGGILSLGIWKLLTYLIYKQYQEVTVHVESNGKKLKRQNQLQITEQKMGQKIEQPQQSSNFDRDRPASWKRSLTSNRFRKQLAVQSFGKN